MRVVLLFIAFCAPCVMCRRGGLAAVLNNVLRYQSLNRLNESLLTTALYLLNQPSTRQLIKEDIGIEVVVMFSNLHTVFVMSVLCRIFGHS